ncbi:dephospho- kinase domain-containing [Brachionus plicatilis]|uniref:Dephospho-kinase domain-containing n=1 Tax=Brachionus plicatilis TaxID=10195 RepID=A0A3M7P894_BRAPC|nr:dephospho- kinase domain-containing [Brachionus plicatilis]
MFLVGLTGGIASGKSTVSKIFNEEFKIPIIDADLIARQVVLPDRTGWKRVRSLFGNEILNQDRTVNRDKLGEIIFSDREKMLNKALHGLILLEILKQILLNLVKGERLVLLDIPLLFETKIGLSLLSYKLVVYCQSEEEQLRRLMIRNPNLSEQEAKKRIQSQMNTADKLKLADYCIDNSKDLENTREQVKTIYSVLKKSKIYLWIRAFLFAGLAFGVFLLNKYLF